MKNNRKMNKNKQRLNGKESKVIVRHVSGFPDQTRVQLCYEDLITVSTVANPYSTYQFRGNSAYDPDFTAAGHQPRYFDQYAAVYNKYKVFGSKIEIEMINGSAVAGAIFALLPLTDTLTATAWPQIAELPRAKVSQILPVSSRYPFKVNHQATTAEINGLQPGQINDEDYGSTVTSNPSSIWYWNLTINSIDVASTIGISFRVRIVLDTLFYDRPYIATS